MPVMNGPEFAFAARKMGFKGLIVGLTGNYRQIIIIIDIIMIIIVTGNAFADDKEIFMKSGVDAVFLKPLNVSELDRCHNHYY